MAGRGGRPAIVWRDRATSYAALLALAEETAAALAGAGVGPGRVVSLEADYSPRAVAALLALGGLGAVVVPLTPAVRAERAAFLAIAGVSERLAVDPADGWRLRARPGAQAPPLVRRLAERRRAGLVLFSSGTSGPSKAALHDLDALLEKFRAGRPAACTLAFLLLDHVGGLNTLFHVLAGGGTVVPAPSRDPDAVCAAIARHRVELLPTSPTFLNLLLLSDAWRRHDLSSLRRVTYGTEVMPDSTLARLRQALPGVRLQQTYGLSEVGILRSRSRDPSSRWMQLGGDGFETRVVDGTLRVRAASAMLGYLNHPSPFDADGWLDTGDLVEVDGDWVRVLGRRSEVVNVGGQKVHPAEVESVLLEMAGVRDVVVFGAASPITGQVVAARVSLDPAVPAAEFKRRMRAFCRDRLAPFKVPVKVELTGEAAHGPRFKRVRRPG
jgi:acyl-CoA synthetase (AMP-forming)/AMP-acid ligase II